MSNDTTLCLTAPHLLIFFRFTDLATNPALTCYRLSHCWSSPGISELCFFQKSYPHVTFLITVRGVSNIITLLHFPSSAFYGTSLLGQWGQICLAEFLEIISSFFAQNFCSDRVDILLCSERNKTGVFFRQNLALWPLRSDPLLATSTPTTPTLSVCVCFIWLHINRKPTWVNLQWTLFQWYGRISLCHSMNIHCSVLWHCWSGDNMGFWLLTCCSNPWFFFLGDPPTNSQ